MANVTPNERYTVKIDASVRTKDELFSRVTDVAFLGYSSFNGWDQFNDMLLGRLETSDILLEIVNEDLSGLPEHDWQTYQKILAEALRQFPQKLLVR